MLCKELESNGMLYWSFSIHRMCCILGFISLKYFSWSISTVEQRSCNVKVLWASSASSTDFTVEVTTFQLQFNCEIFTFKLLNWLIHHLVFSIVDWEKVDLLFFYYFFLFFLLSFSSFFFTFFFPFSFLLFHWFQLLIIKKRV